MKKTNRLLSEDIEKEYEVKWNPQDFTLTILGGRARFTPEMVDDLRAYYGIEPQELFQFVREASLNLPPSTEVDIRVSSLPSRNRHKESIWRMQALAFDTKEVLAEVYFSGTPIMPAEIKTK